MVNYYSSSKTFTKKGRNGANSFDSQVSLQNVFIGEYVDEFFLVSLFSNNVSELVLLGSSIGAAIRSASSIKNYEQIICVDPDTQSLNELNYIYKDELDWNQVKTFKGNAKLFLNSISTKKDSNVIIDMFDDNGHAMDLENESFYHDIARKFSSKSVFQLNLYSYPTYLASSENELLGLINLIKKHFLDVKIVEYRRNISVIFSNTCLTKNKLTPNESLNKRDKDFLKLRTKSLNVKSVNAKNVDIDLSYKNINELFKNHYTQYYFYFKKEYALDLNDKSALEYFGTSKTYAEKLVETSFSKENNFDLEFVLTTLILKQIHCKALLSVLEESYWKQGEFNRKRIINLMSLALVKTNEDLNMERYIND